ncbi:MAG: SDR family oxidoreductase [Alphaproteobacteria bacterium]|nr:SDR family oxidoreductase [Alphaproteobacteria bacterium]
MSLDIYKTAIVTGASRGIGAALVRRLRAKGLTVHAVARSADALDALKRETGCVPHALDVADRAAVVKTFAGMPVDVLVNNAGILAPAGAIFDHDAASVDKLFQINVAGVINFLAAAAPGMKARRRGHIVNVSSMAGLMISPGIPVYAASKAALHSLSQTLRIDLHGSNVRVSEIAPGRVKSGMHLQMMDDPKAAQERYYDGLRCLEPEDVADAIMFVLAAPERMDVTLMEINPTDQSYGGVNYHRAQG